MADDITLRITVDAANAGTAVQQVRTQLEALGNAGRTGATTATTAMQQFERATASAMQGSSASLNMLGAGFGNVAGALRDPPSLVDKLAEGFKRLNDEGRRGEAVVALRELVGRGNIALVAVLEGGTEEVQRLKKAFYETGASIDDSVGRSMKEVIEKI